MTTTIPNSVAVPSPTSATWSNWSKNLSYTPPNGAAYYYSPRNAQELRQILAQAASKGKKVRVSGQRHSQPPLVANGPAPAGDNLYLIDLSCYADLGNGSERMVINGNSITVNAGVREDELDAYLTKNKLMLETVTAGGIFSVGGMTAVDVHGATTEAPIFAETASAFSIMGADGVVTTIDANSPQENGWGPLQFARVSLGALGVVTSVTLEVLPRPYANSLVGGLTESDWESEAEFVKSFGALLASKTRVETFFNPYADGILASRYIACWWNVVDGSGAAPAPPTVENACQLASQHKYGAAYLSWLEEEAGEWAAMKAQEASSKDPAYAVSFIAVNVIKSAVKAVNNSFSDLWLTKAARTVFMSYFVELPDLGAAGLGLVWRALKGVEDLVRQNGKFHIAAPMEFRFLKSGNTAMAGTYSKTPGTSYFVNLDLIAFVAQNSSSNGLVYTDKMKGFFAAVERQWVAIGGWPHQGKMYGFYDPNGAADNYSEPFNPAFISNLRNNRADRVQAFNKYRMKRDPQNMFYNDYLAKLIG